MKLLLGIGCYFLFLYDTLIRAKIVLDRFMPLYLPCIIFNDEDFSIHRSKYSLNAISHDSAIGLVKQVLEKGANIKEVGYDNSELLQNCR